MIRLHCFACGKSVSTEVPDNTIVRAILTCPECIEQIEEDSKKNMKEFYVPKITTNEVDHNPT